MNIPGIAIFTSTHSKLVRILKRLKNYVAERPALKIACIALLVLCAAHLYRLLRPRRLWQSITWRPIHLMLEDLKLNKIKEAVIRNSRLYFLSSSIFQTDFSELSLPTMTNLLKQSNVLVYPGIPISVGSKLPETLMNIGLSTFVSSCFAYVITEFVLNLNGSSFKSANTSKPSQVVTFKDVYGLERPKEVLQETIDFLKNPGRYEDVGCRLRRGIIFYGPPGTGKTLLAKATAGETNSQFISCSASEFCEMYVGVGAKRVRELFEKAREYESTIILIDEIDALGKRRNDFDASDTERNSTLNQILTEMDGFGTNGRILVIAATNRLEMVDAALLRSGRFDLKIQISLPNPQEREGILRLHLSKLKTNLDARTISTIVKRTEHWSGADIEALCNQAAYRALKKKQQNDRVTDQDLLGSLQTIKRSTY